MGSTLAPVFAGATAKAYFAAAYNRLLETRLALQAFRAETGAYPERLSALAPRYLARVPDDPFADRKPLAYRRTGTAYVLYSIGPDAKDDGGTPIVNTDYKAAPERKYMVFGIGDEHGDLVAGVNR